MKTPNNTATGGYMQPAPQPPVLVTVPQGLNFLDFLQSVIVGLSGLPGPMVRPEWQQRPPKRPTVDQNWIALGIEGVDPDFDAYEGFLAPMGDNPPQPYLQRNELIPLVVNVYGPNSYENYGLLRDNFQIQQNRAALQTANVGFAYDTQAQHVPELINEIWYDRWRVIFYLRRQIIRTYPILTFVSAGATVYANDQGGETTTLPITVEESE